MAAPLVTDVGARLVLQGKQVYIAGLDEATAATERLEKATASAAESAKVSSREQVAAARETAAGVKMSVREQIASTDTSAAVAKASGASAFATLKKVGAAVGLLGAGVAFESVKMAGNFQKQTSVLVTAAGESMKNLAGIRTGILNIASSTGTAWQDLTAGEYVLEKAGYRGAASLKVLTAAAQGASEEGASLASVTNAMTSVMASYHIGASNAVQVMNALKTAAGESKTTMENYATSLSTVIPIASANKIGFDQVAGAIATLTQHGTSASEATQELASTIRALAAPNSVATTMMQQLGLNVKDVTTGLGKRGLTGTISLLVGAITKSMGPAGTVLLKAFNQSKTGAQDATTMISAMTGPLQAIAQRFADGTITQGDYMTALKALSPQSASLGREFETTENKARGFNAQLRSGLLASPTFTDALKKMSGGAIGLNTVLQLSGGNLAGFQTRVNAVSRSLKDSGSNVEGWAQTSKLFDTQVARLRQTMDKLSIELGSKLIPILQGVGGWFAKHIGVTKALAVIVGIGLVGAFTAWAASMAWEKAATGIRILRGLALGFQLLAGAELEADAMAAANPIGLIVVAVAALAFGVYELVTHWKTVWGAIKEAASAAWSFLKNIFETSLHWIERTWNSVWGSVSGFFTRIWHDITGALSSALGWVQSEWNGAWASVTSVLRTAWAVVTEVVGAAMSWIRTHLGTEIDAVVKLWKAEWNLLTGIASVAFNLVMAVVKIGMSLVRLLIVTQIRIVETVWSGVWWAISGVMKAVWSVLSTVFHAIVSAGLWYVRKELQVLSATWSAVWDTITTVVGDTWGFLKPIFADVVNLGLHVVRDEISALKTIWSDVWSSASAAVSLAWSFLKPILDAISNAVGKVAGVINTLGNGLHSVGSFLGGIGNSVSGAINGLSSGGSKKTATPTSLASLPRRALGGSVFAGESYIVGENQAEVFTPTVSGWIHPSMDVFNTLNASYGMAGNGGGSTVSNSWTNGTRWATPSLSSAPIGGGDASDSSGAAVAGSMRGGDITVHIGTINEAGNAQETYRQVVRGIRAAVARE